MIGASKAGSWPLALFPLLAALVAVAFAGSLALRFRRVRRPHEGVWAIALAMYAVASFAMFLGVSRGWTTGEYRVYWLFGAALNVPFLAQGELYLLGRSRRAAHVAVVVLVAISAVAAWVAATESIRPGSLAKHLPLGKDAWGSSSLAYQLRWLSWAGYLALVGGIVWSVQRMRGRPELRPRVAGILGIGLGATIVAIGSGVGAGLDVVPLFSVSLAAGVAAMYWGFLAASRPASSLPARIAGSAG